MLFRSRTVIVLPISSSICHLSFPSPCSLDSTLSLMYQCVKSSSPKGRSNLRLAPTAKLNGRSPSRFAVPPTPHRIVCTNCAALYNITRSRKPLTKRLPSPSLGGDQLGSDCIDMYRIGTKYTLYGYVYGKNCSRVL